MTEVKEKMNNKQTKNIEAKQGATVKIETKRGTGTRDQDKVNVKVHTAEPVDAESLENACEEARKKAITKSVKNLTEPNSDFEDSFIEAPNTDASSLRDMSKAFEKAAKRLENSE